MLTGALNTRGIGLTGIIPPRPRGRLALNKFALNQASLNAFRSDVYEVTGIGHALTFNTFETKSKGSTSVVLLPFDAVRAKGAGRVFNSYSARNRGVFKLSSDSFFLLGAGLHSITQGFNHAAVGVGDVENTFFCDVCGYAYLGVPTHNTSSPGVFSLGYDSFSLCAAGCHVLHGYDSMSAQAKGAFEIGTIVTIRAVGLTRIANDRPQFCLYRGVDGAQIDFSSPWQTFDTLPHNTPPLPPGHSYSFVLRRQNNYNLSSLNRDAWTVTVLPDGDAEEIYLDNPDSEIQVIDGVDVLISSFYNYQYTDNEADLWLLYITTDGSDPTTNGIPEEVVMVKSDGIAKLRRTVSGNLPGAVIKVIVRVKDSVNGFVSLDETILSATITSAGSIPPQGDIFY